MTEREGLSWGEAVEWCGETITVREATRLRRLASERQEDDSGDQGGECDNAQGGVSAETLKPPSTQPAHPMRIRRTPAGTHTPRRPQLSADDQERLATSAA